MVGLWLPSNDDRMKPEFFSSRSDFGMVMKSVNYLVDVPLAQGKQQDTIQANRMSSSVAIR
jgi:hypothetical protein